ncbi:MAG: Uncharacterised protein [Flavobacteriales bacterium UBA4585]|nr:MAG: Uncharacterised protein [Flavobacteriales bacterium UBA4585]
MSCIYGEVGIGAKQILAFQALGKFFALSHRHSDAVGGDGLRPANVPVVAHGDFSSEIELVVHSENQ